MELLIVLAIIAMLAAILVPAFARAKETANQTNCAANLSQIFIAVREYRDDEGYYPNGLHDLMAAGFINSDKSLICPEDDVEGGSRSSYGDRNGEPTCLYSCDDPGRMVWNFWGLNEDGWSLKPAGNPADPDAANATGRASARIKPATAYDRIKNPINYSLSNRFAPGDTVITHCVFHRMATSSINDFTSLYDDPALGAGARDIVLRIDGAARTVDVSRFKDASMFGPGGWVRQDWQVR